MAYGVVFIAIATLWFHYAAASVPWVVRLLFVNAGSSFLVIGLGYLANEPRIFAKRVDGTHPWYVKALHWPYFVINRFTFALHTTITRENPYDEVEPHIFLGRLPGAGDKALWQEITVASVLDLTAEFAEPEFVRAGRVYLCLPTLDTMAPADLMCAAQFIETGLANGTVYVHCAMGHGRSATALAAYLLSADRCSSVGEAEERMKQLRPGVGLNPRQRMALEALRRTIEAPECQEAIVDDRPKDQGTSSNE